MSEKGVCLVCEMGLLGYGKAWELQKRLHELRVRQEIPDILLLLEHPPTVTIGKSGSLSNVLAPSERLAEMGISLFFIERGGDVTYHGPGQLVGYPIVDLRKRGKDIYKLVTDLEEVMIRTVRDFSIEAGRDPGHRGVWVKQEELGAIGISVRKWVTMHGFALNVTTDLQHFSLINPCGFTDRQATSMAACISRDVSMESVRMRLQGHFASVFNVELVTRSKQEVLVTRESRPSNGFE
ncbi:MAG: lipoyl(octanoyl) transferase LipB [Syntrophorhabdales bacterium]|jgi:lipoate-protein ligase B